MRWLPVREKDRASVRSQQGLEGLSAMKIVPIKQEDLPGTVVMATCVNELQLSLDEFKAALDGINRLIDEQIQILKAFADLYIELTNETANRAWIRDRIEKAERERSRLRVPIWFWRPEEGKRLQAALMMRAVWMHENDYLEDDIFDLLQEYLEHLGHQRLPDSKMASIVRVTRTKSAPYGSNCDADASR